MCKFCHDKTPTVIRVIKDDDENYGDGKELNLSIQNGCLYIDGIAVAGWSSISYEAIYKINYCPMCGRKLKAGAANEQ